jgi:hypothetical protein
MALLLGAMVGLVLWRRLPFLGPVPPGGLYDSDAAVPVLMSNLATGGPVDWLFWGQDRFGAWPFLGARLAGALVDRAWTPHGMHVLRTLWMVAALVPWLGLAGRAGPVAAAGFLLLPATGPLLQRVLPNLGTVDGWQLPALLWAWWGLRGAARSARPGRWLALAAVAGALATWTSLVSAPLLVVLAVVEGRGGEPGIRRRAALGLPVLAGLVLEGTVRGFWHRTVRSQGWDVRTPASLDLGHLLENAGRVLATAWQVGAVPWLLAAVLAAAAALAVRRWRTIPEACTVAGAGLAALTALLVVISVRHVRENGYHPRYLCLPLSLAVLGSWVPIGLGVRALADRFLPRAAPVATGVLALAAVALLAPVAGPDPREELLRPVAAELSARHRGAVLAASYWRAYALAALVPPGAVVPVPREGEWNRRPDWTGALRSGRPVLVGSPDHPGEAPPPRLVERGAPLLLVQPDVLTVPPFPGESTGERLSLYRLAPDGG